MSTNTKGVSCRDVARMPRRQFLKSSAAAAGLLGMPWIVTSSALGADGAVSPSNRINVALIGHGAMGRGHLHRLAGDPQIQVMAVCDPDRERRDAGRELVEQRYASAMASGAYKGCAAYNDFRDVLARSDIDAVVIATPDHWHSLLAIEAAKAGKDIYCEKPVSVTIEESRRVVQAVTRYGRVFQTGTQYRSNTVIRQVTQFVRKGGLGKVKSVFTLLNNLGGWINSDRASPFASVLNPERCGRSYVPMDFALPADPVPEGLDWDMWVGPAPWRDYNRLYHINPSPGVVPWSFCDAFGVTSSTWFLSHAADVIQYALGVERSGPVEIIHPSSGDFPTLTFRYASGTLLHFVDHWGMVKELYHAVPADARLEGNFGGVFVGERGWMTSMSVGGPIEGAPDDLFREMGLEKRDVNVGSNNHHANWFECIRTRQKPSCDEELGHRTATIGHLTNIAFWTGRSLKWDPAREEFSGCEAANRLRSRAMRAPWGM